jgi:farnesyl-diphosphate farnesyltransferase
LETYIGYVAGEPGRFWTNVLLQHGLLPDGAMRDGLLNDGFEFGKGLQMINILKDMQDDLARGRCYIPLTLLKERGLSPADLLTDKADQTFLPLYHELLKQTVSRLRRGLDYLKRLPTWDFRLRAAVWWPLAIGLATLSRLRAADARKITRGQVYRILGSSVLYMPSDRLLRWEFERLAEDVQPSLY